MLFYVWMSEREDTHSVWIMFNLERYSLEFTALSGRFCRGKKKLLFPKLGFMFTLEQSAVSKRFQPRLQHVVGVVRYKCCCIPIALYYNKMNIKQNSRDNLASE